MTSNRQRRKNDADREAAARTRGTSVGDATAQPIPGVRLGGGTPAAGTRARGAAPQGDPNYRFSTRERGELDTQGRGGQESAEQRERRSRRSVLLAGLGIGVLGAGALTGLWGAYEATHPDEPEPDPQRPTTPGSAPTVAQPYPYTRIGTNPSNTGLSGADVIAGDTNSTGGSSNSNANVMKGNGDNRSTFSQSNFNFPAGKLEAGEDGIAVFDISGTFGRFNSRNNAPSVFAFGLRSAHGGVTLDFRARSDGKPGMMLTRPEHNVLVRDERDEKKSVHFNRDGGFIKEYCHSLIGDMRDQLLVNSNHVKVITLQHRVGENKFETYVGIVDAKAMADALARTPGGNDREAATESLIANRTPRDAIIGLYKIDNIGQLQGLDRAIDNGDPKMEYSLNNAYPDTTKDNSWRSTWSNNSNNGDVTDQKIRQMLYFAFDSHLALDKTLQGQSRSADTIGVG